MSNRANLEARFERGSSRTILEIMVQYNLGVLVGFEVVQVCSLSCDLTSGTFARKMGTSDYQRVVVDCKRVVSTPCKQKVKVYSLVLLLHCIYWIIYSSRSKYYFSYNR